MGRGLFDVYVRDGIFSRSDEYIFFLFLGSASVTKSTDDMLNEGQSETKSQLWFQFVRTGKGNLRVDSKNLFYPIFYDPQKGKIMSIGNPIPLDQDKDTIIPPAGQSVIWPMTASGQEARWRTSKEVAERRLSKGLLRLGKTTKKESGYSVLTVNEGTEKKIESGEITVSGYDENGSTQLIDGVSSTLRAPKTMWNRVSHNAGWHGSKLLAGILPGVKFPYPKSLYAVEDCLRFVVSNKPYALIVDFFAGSGTTLHATNLLNYEDGGNRRCILVTNNEVQSAEGGEIPTDVYGESFDQPQYVTYTVKKAHKKKKEEAPIPGQLPLYPSDDTPQSIEPIPVAPVASTNPAGSQTPAQQVPVVTSVPSTDGNTAPAVTQPSVSITAQPAEQPIHTPQPVVIPEKDPESEQEDEVEDLFDREGVMKFINDSGLLTYNVRSLKINNYLVSLLKMVHLLSQCDLYPSAVKDVTADIVAKIRAYVDDLKSKGKYDALVVQVKQFKLATQIFDVFGESVDNFFVHDIFTTTDTDIDRQFRLADVQLGNEGIGNEYGRLYYDEADPSAFQIDVILFAADSDCILSPYI